MTEQKIRSLITGIGGFVASHLADLLLEKGEEVIPYVEKIASNAVAQIDPDIIVSYGYKYILKNLLLACPTFP